MKTMIFGVILAAGGVSAYAENPRPLPAATTAFRQQAPNPMTAAGDETGQKRWDEDVQSTFQKMKKLKRELALLTHENNGLKAMLEGDHARAVADYDALLGLDPDQMDARLYRAASKSALGDDRGALNDYDAVLKQLTAAYGRGDADARKRTRTLLSRAYGDRASIHMRLGLKGDRDPVALDRALDDCDQALRVGHPRPSIMVWQKSQILFAAGRFSDAARTYQEALTLDPKLASVGDHAAFCRKFAEEKISVESCN